MFLLDESGRPRLAGGSRSASPGGPQTTRGSRTTRHAGDRGRRQLRATVRWLRADLDAGEAGDREARVLQHLAGRDLAVAGVGLVGERRPP